MDHVDDDPRAELDLIKGELTEEGEG